MRQYVITDAEMQSLIDQLELHAMRKINVMSRHDPDSQLIQEIHRAFHFVAVRWTQSMGFTKP